MSKQDLDTHITEHIQLAERQRVEWDASVADLKAHWERYLGLAAGKTIVVDRKGNRYEYVEIRSFYENTKSKPWVSGRKILRGGATSKIASTLYGDWTIEPTQP